MKNMTARFTCATESTLTISSHRGKKDWVISYRQRTPGAKTRIGKDYVDLSREDEAQALFDTRVKEALAAGWIQTERTVRTASAFTAIPQAPTKVPTPVAAAAGGQSATVPRTAAAAGRR
jgi:hypothetical protein